LFVHLAKGASADIISKIVSHREPVEVFGGVLVTLLGSHVCHLFMGNSNNFASDDESLVGGFVRDIWTISIVILPPFYQNSVTEYRIRVLIVLANNIEEGIRQGGFPDTVVPLAFKVRCELEGVDIECLGGLIRERITVVDWGIRGR